MQEMGKLLLLLLLLFICMFLSFIQIFSVEGIKPMFLSTFYVLLLTLLYYWLCQAKMHLKYSKTQNFRESSELVTITTFSPFQNYWL